MAQNTTVIGGIEGGATHSHAVLLTSDGTIIGRAKGPGTNHYLIGIEECRRRIVELVNKAKQDAGISEDTPLLALGLSLSGCSLHEANRDIEMGLLKDYPYLSENYVVRNDTEGSLAATSNKGGITCIAGTGSNTLLINPDGTKSQCGGLGYLLGDEGSAWKISWRAIKYCLDDLDDLEKPPHPTKKIWNLVKNHFNVENQSDIVEYFYTQFDKAFISSMCKDVAVLAQNGDPLAKTIFKESGIEIAKNICAILPKADPQLFERPGGIHILCVGSVWLSWDLLKQGFVSHMKQHSPTEVLSLMRLTVEMGVGAALMASDLLDLRLDRDYSKNYNVFYVYDKNKVMDKVLCNGNCNGGGQLVEAVHIAAEG